MHTCDHCGGKAQFKCGNCHDAVYCNERCADADWHAGHEMDCEALAYDTNEHQHGVDAPILYDALCEHLAGQSNDRIGENILSEYDDHGPDTIHLWCEDACNHLLTVDGPAYKARMYATLLVPGGSKRVMKKIRDGKYKKEQLQDILQTAETLKKRAFSSRRKKKWQEVIDKAQSKLNDLGA